MITDDDLYAAFGPEATLERIDDSALPGALDIIRGGVDFATKTGQNPKGVRFDDVEHQLVRIGDPHHNAPAPRRYIVFKNAVGAVDDPHDIEVILERGGEIVGREFVAFAQKGRDSEE